MSSGYGGRKSRSENNSRRYQGDQRSMWDRASDEVSSWFGDDDAERRRNEDQHRGRGPKNYTRSDDRIKEDVCDRLSDDHTVDASEIEVEVSKGEVTLTGTVKSRDQRRRAEDCAEAISGVSHVQNNIRVDNGQISQGAGMYSSGLQSQNATMTPTSSNAASSRPADKSQSSASTSAKRDG